MTEPTNTPSKTPAESQAEPNPEGDLGDAGKKALEAERRARKEAEREAKDARDELTEIKSAETRRSVAADKGLTDEQAGFLTGATREEMEAKADELLTAFRAEENDTARRTPRERLRSGAAPGVEPKDIGSIADDVVKGW